MVALATVLVAVVLAVGGAVVGLVLRTTLADDVERAAVLRARDLAALVADGAVPRTIPIAGRDEALVQVVVGGRVVAASANVRGAPPVVAAPPPPGEVVVTRADGLPVPDEADEPFVVAATTARPTPDGTPATVIVAASLEPVDEAMARAGAIGLAAWPVTVAALSWAMWLVVGRTLAPVEAIRAEAEAIGGSALHRRVPEPAAHDEVGRLARTLNRMLARIEASAQRQERFVADAAHELRTPIAAVRARLEAARAAPEPPDWDAVADDVLAATASVETLTEQLLVLARADGGALDRRHRAVDLDDVVVDVAVAPTPSDPAAAPGSTGPPRVDVSAVEPVQLRGDPVLIEQVVRNLVDNARRHAAARIAVSTRLEGDRAVLLVDDDGPGVPADQRAAVFERFTRLDHARARDDGGAGLGLAIVAALVAAHEGTVRIVDSPLGGARVEVTFPAGRAPG